MANVFSLSTVQVVMTKKNSSGGADSQLTIGGAGKLTEQVGYRYDNDMFTMESSPDGGWVANYNGSRAGTISISLKQTSAHIDELTNYINSCHFGKEFQNVNPDGAESNIEITDLLGNILVSATGCFPRKLPENTVGTRVSSRSFEFVCGDIVVNTKASGGSN